MYVLGCPTRQKYSTNVKLEAWHSLLKSTWNKVMEYLRQSPKFLKGYSLGNNNQQSLKCSLSVIVITRYTANIYSRCKAKVLPRSCTVTWNTANDCAQCLAVPFYSQVTATIQLMTVNQTVIDIPVITHANDCNQTVWKWLLVYYTTFDSNPHGFFHL